MTDRSGDVSQVIAEAERLTACDCGYAQRLSERVLPVRFISHSNWCKSQAPVAHIVIRELVALLRDRPALSAAASNELETLRGIVTRAYAMAQDHHSAQRFCFMSAPDSMRRTAHEVARDGFNELAAVLGVGARPVLKAEWNEASRAAAAAQSPAAREATTSGSDSRVSDGETKEALSGAGQTVIAERLREYVRRHTSGCCWMLSLGDACLCPLCDIDRLVALSSASARETKP